MKRKLICAILCLLVVLSSAGICFAEPLPCVVDEAGLLSQQETDSLTEKAEDLRHTYEMDVVILTVTSLNGKSSMAYAEDYYDESGYGIDAQRSGVLFLLAMEEREWYIDTSGDAVYAVSDYALLQMEEMVLPYLRDGDYYTAFDVWLDALGVYFWEYANGTPVDGIVPEEDQYQGHEETVYYPEYDDREDNSSHRKLPPVNWLISVGVGVLATCITVFVMSSMMNTKRSQNSAGAYMKTGSYQLRVRRDTFLYSQVSKTRRESSSGSSSGGSRSRSGGGSSVHRSSSGRTHGGRGGKF